MRNCIFFLLFLLQVFGVPFGVESLDFSTVRCSDNFSTPKNASFILKIPFMRYSLKNGNLPQIASPGKDQGGKQGVSKGASFSNIEDDQEEHIYHNLLKNFPDIIDLNHYGFGSNVLLFYFNSHWRPPKLLLNKFFNLVLF